MALSENSSVIRHLDNAIEAAKLKRCGVEEEHQEAMKLYLDTWVVMRLEGIRRVLVGEQKARDLPVR